MPRFLSRTGLFGILYELVDFHRFLLSPSLLVLSRRIAYILGDDSTSRSIIIHSACLARCQIFLEYHGHKRWANPNYIRNTLVTLGLSKGGNEPLKQNHFSRQAMVASHIYLCWTVYTRQLGSSYLSCRLPPQLRIARCTGKGGKCVAALLGHSSRQIRASHIVVLDGQQYR